MTNPPPPPASAMGLVERWRAMARRHRECGPNGAALAEVREHDADELAAALSLSEDEREAIKALNDELEFNCGPATLMERQKALRIRQLIRRLTEDTK